MPLGLSLAIRKAKPYTRRAANGYNVFVSATRSLLHNTVLFCYLLRFSHTWQERLW